MNPFDKVFLVPRPQPRQEDRVVVTLDELEYERGWVMSETDHASGRRFFKELLFGGSDFLKRYEAYERTGNAEGLEPRELAVQRIAESRGVRFPLVRMGEVGWSAYPDEARLAIVFRYNSGNEASGITSGKGNE